MKPKAKRSWTEWRIFYGDGMHSLDAAQNPKALREAVKVFAPIFKDKAWTNAQVKKVKVTEL